MTATPDQIAQWICESPSTVAFTGAGISTESGIPDFRSPGGVWANSQPVYYDEFLRSAEARHEYWRQKAEAHTGFTNAEPNAAHRVLASWESTGILRGVITQNIDGMHQLAGSNSVLEVHGTAREVACLQCNARFDADGKIQAFLQHDCPPNCPKCEGLLKHATISFGQQLDSEVLDQSTDWAQGAALFFALGSSLVVQPAAGLPQLAKHSGSRLVIINRDPTPLDHLADAVIHGGLGGTLTAIDEALISYRFSTRQGKRAR
ncbi:MAG: Sir2 family NAD-dependent protein deacetylase [Pirellulales bacterium]